MLVIEEIAISMGKAIVWNVKGNFNTNLQCFAPKTLSCSDANARPTETEKKMIWQHVCNSKGIA